MSVVAQREESSSHVRQASPSMGHSPRPAKRKKPLDVAQISFLLAEQETALIEARLVVGDIERKIKRLERQLKYAQERQLNPKQGGRSKTARTR
jgi:hypothetical protein